MKKALSLFLSIVLVLGIFMSVPFTESPFKITAEAASVSDLTFKLSDDGESYYVSDCKSSASGALAIPGTYNGKPVTSIGGDAFYCCYSLTSITIPDSVTSIGDGAFDRCYSLESVTIPDSITSIGDGAFSSCDSLTSITISDSVTSIGDEAFEYCLSLTTINVSSSNQYYTSVDGVLFNKAKTELIQYPEGKTSTSYTIPDSVTSIGTYAFYYCHSLTSITIPDSVTSIGNEAFYNCDSLTSIIIPDSVTSIGDSAFSWCDSLTSITIPDSVTSIGDGAFSSCDSLTSITIPDSVTSIGNEAFYNCDSLTSIIIPDSVTSIGDSAFSWCDSLTSITIPDSVTSIGDGAFSSCDLTSITIPDSVTSIGDDAFSFCESLTSITIPDSVTSIGNYAFSGCDSLTAINVSSSNQYYTSVDGVLFNKAKTEIIQYPAGKTSTSYIIPDSVTSIGDEAFYDCESLTSITIPDSVTSIGDGAFDRCYSLESVTIPDSITSIGDGAFSSCDSLTSITISDSVTSIGDYAFEYCTSLTSITIPDSVTSIGDYAFEYCTSLTSITIPDSVTSIGDYAFEYCTSLTSITIPDSVTSIGDYAFEYCTSLTSITIPDSVTSIGDYAFCGCDSLTSITIPDSVTSIGNSAFSYCKSLLDVYYYGFSEDWLNISIDSYNTYLTDARIHYGVTDVATHLGEAISTTEATCTQNGIFKYTCSCGYEATENIPALGHSYVDGICTTCGAQKSYGSEHPYGSNSNEEWVIEKAGATSISITFSDDTETESGYDYIYIYDGNGNEIGDYSGTSLAGETVTVAGDTVKIRLTSDGSEQYYGFELTSIIAHWFGEWLIRAEPTCTETGVQYRVCSECGEEETAEIPVTEHNYVDGYCSVCGADALTYSFNADSESYSVTGCNEDASGALEIPSIYNGKPVTSIGDWTFYHCIKLTSITIPDSVTSIGDSAFYYCTSLTSINVSSSNQYFTSVDGVLFNKAKTELIQYPAGKTSTSYTIPNSVTSIGDDAFCNCTSLKSITIPNSVTSIGKSAFLACTSLTSITIPNSVTSIGVETFRYCDSLTSVTIPDSVTSIGPVAFDGCTSLESITIPNSVTSIDFCAFLNTGLTSIYIPETVKTIVEGAVGYIDYGKYVEKVDGFIIYGVSGTSAETYANENGFTFIEIEQECPHTSTKWVTDKAATCTVAGSKHKECTECGETLETQAISATGHTKSDWITDKKATVNAAGSQHKECTECGAVLETAVIPQLKPSDPTLSKATNANGGVTVTWKAVSGADSYRVYRKTSSSGWTCLNSKVTSTSYTDKSAKSGTTYYYTVRAENEAGLSGYNSTGVSVKYLAMPTVTIANAATGIKVSWNKITGASKYYVYRKASGENSWTRLTDSATGTSYTDTKAKSGTTYYYTVKAVSGSTSSEYKSSSALKYLAQPKVSSLSNENSGITVKWGKITGASGYYVYRKTGSGSWSLIYTVKSGSTVSYTDKSAKAGTTYYYTVRAYNGSVKSTYTSSSAIRRLTTPTLKSVSSAKSGITFKWNKVTGASGYYVYRKTGSGGWQKIATVKNGSTVSYPDKTAKKGTTYTYTVRAYYSSSISYFNTTGLKIKDKY